MQYGCKFATVCVRKGYTYVHDLVKCVDKACCILVIVHMPTGYRLVDSLSLKTSQNFYKADTRCDSLLLSVRKNQVGGFYILLCKQEELNSWILRLAKAGLVVTQTSDRRLLTSLYKKQEQLSVV